MEIKGRIKQIFEPKTGTSAKGDWKMQDILIEIPNDKYPTHIVVQTKGCDLNIGSEVTCQLNINAREFNGRWYNSINAWKIECNTPQDKIVESQETDDLPF